MPHTPGPWKAEKIRSTGLKGKAHHTYRIRSEHNTAYTALLGQNQEANAALIAAAPDLLAALQEASRALTELDPLGDHHHTVLLDNALAKAEGRIV